MKRSFYVDTYEHRARAVNFIGNQEPPFLVDFGPQREHRSLTQNARLWLLHTMAGEHLGYSPEEMHEHALCHHFGYKEREVKDPLTGEISSKRVPNRRSSGLDKTEFRAFMDATEVWYGNDFGCWLP